MKRLIAILIVCMVLFPLMAYADTYTLDEILPSVAAYTDDELQTLLDAIAEEQDARRAAGTANEAEEPQKQVDETPYVERADYVERKAVQRGDKGENALAVQTRLIELGYLGGTADGDFGKKSEAAVKIFQKANRLEETGIADSITQYVMYSEEAIDKETYDNMPIATGDGWEMLKEYYYKTSWYNYYIFVLKNTSGYDAEISCDVVFYDENDNMVGVSNGSERACENGYETYWSFSNDIEFDHATVEIKMSKETWYKGGQSSIELSTNIVGNKAIITAKNTGKKAVEFVEYHILFLDDNGNVVSTGWGYLTDSDSEIKPGAQEMREESYSKGFADVRVYAMGRIDK